MPDTSRIQNLTAECSSYSILSTGPLVIELPYLVREDEQVDETKVKVFRAGQEFAALGNLQPIESLQISRTSEL
jgi:hypothetical protein